MDKELIAFVQQTTQAITTMSEVSRGLQATTLAIKESTAQHFADAKACHAEIVGKLDGLRMMFLYVIVPLIAGILALVGVKFIFNLPAGG